MMRTFINIFGIRKLIIFFLPALFILCSLCRQAQGQNISGSEYHSLLVCNDSTVWASGDNGKGQLGDSTYVGKPFPVKAIGLSGIAAVEAGPVHSLFLKNDGTVWACGLNNK